MIAPNPISDASIIILIWRVVQQMRERGDGLALDCILNEEKLLHLTILSLERKTLKAAPFDLTQEVACFIQKINKLTMESLNKKTEESSTGLFIKAIDLLMSKNIGKHISPAKILGELKVLTFNNLACIYKRKKKHPLALRAVSFALEIEQTLLQDQVYDQKHNIVTTYLNKAAVLSEMGKHDRAIEQINKGSKVIRAIEGQMQEKGQKVQDEQYKKKEQEKKYYTMYMKMMVYYNLGAENEHLNLTETAVGFYKKGKAIAKLLSNEFMDKRITQILQKLSGQEPASR